MDKHLRMLIQVAEENPSKANACVQEAYANLKSILECKKLNEPVSVGPDILVLLAEAAVKSGIPEIASDCLQIYTVMEPPPNQFLGRAYIAQANLTRPTSNDNHEELDKPIAYLLKTIEFAKKNNKYHFLIYNASLVYYEIVRPFLRPNFRQHLVRSLPQIVKALEDVNDPDLDWRSQLLIILLECRLAAGQRKEVIQQADSVVLFVSKHSPHLLKDLLLFLIMNNLGTADKYQWWSRSSAELTVFYRLCRARVGIRDKDPELSAPIELARILRILMGEEPISLPAVSPTSDTKSSGSSGSSTVSKAQLIPTAAGIAATSAAAVTVLKKFVPEAKAELFLDLGRLALDQGLIEIVKQCVNSLQSLLSAGSWHNAWVHSEMEFLGCDLLVRQLGVKAERYSQPVVDLRVQAIGQCHEALINAIRSGRSSTIQAGCATQWNLCLPLLQTNLRQNLRRPLTLVAEALENICSLLHRLRCQVHMELAKCEADEEQISQAITNLRKAVDLDDTGEYRESLQVSTHRLKLRAELYSTPDRPEDKAGQIIEQARSSSAGESTTSGQSQATTSIQTRRSLLIQAGLSLAPDAFGHVMDADSSTLEVTGKGPLTPIRRMAWRAAQFDEGMGKVAGHLRRLGAENDRERVNLWADLAKTARRQEVWDVCRVACRFCLLYDDGRWKNPHQSRHEGPSRKGKQSRSGAVSGTGGEGASPGTSGETAQQTQQQGDTSGPSSEVASLAQMTPMTTGDSTGRRTVRRGDTGEGSRPTSPSRRFRPSLYEKELVRLLAEVYFIEAEATIHLLRTEKAEIWKRPPRPRDMRKHAKGFSVNEESEDKEWDTYCRWVDNLSELAIASFLRAARLGVELGEPWLVVSAAAYLWNYTIHLLQEANHRKLVEPFQVLFDCLRKVGYEGQSVLMVELATVLAHGLLQPWLPPPDSALPPREIVLLGSGGQGSESSGGVTGSSAGPAPTSPSASPGKGKKTGSARGKQTASSALPRIYQPPSEALSDLKKSLEASQYAMEVAMSSGRQPGDAIPLEVLQGLCQVWVQAKQLLQQTVTKALGAGIEDVDGQQQQVLQGPRAAIRVIVAVEMVWLNRNGAVEMREADTLQEVFLLVESFTWESRLVELQLWTKLAYLAMQQEDHNLVMMTSDKSFRLALTQEGQSSQDQQRSEKVSRRQRLPLVRRGAQVEQLYRAEHELLAHVASLRGQSLLGVMQGKVTIRRQAMEAFLQSARFAREAYNYTLVSSAVRHFWHTCSTLIGQSIERELLQEPVRSVLQCLTATVNRNLIKKFFDSHNEEDEAVATEASAKSAAREDQVVVSASQHAPVSAAMGTIFPSMQRPQPQIQDLEQDLTMRAQMYSVVFQAYADKGKWEEGIQVLDEAVAEFPRTRHRLPLFRHRALTKAKLGQSPLTDIQKFRDEPEDKQSELWRMVALCSRDTSAQLEAYQRAVELLTLSDNDWQKVDLLLEFAQWLYCNDFPLDDCADQIEWAIDILINMKLVPAEKKEDGRRPKQGKSVAATAASGGQQGKSSAAGANKRFSQQGAASPDLQVTEKGSKQFKKKKSTSSTGSTLPVDTAEGPTKSNDKSGQNEDSESGNVVPMAKPAVIGVLHPVEGGITSSTKLQHIRQLDNLVRAYLLLTNILGPGDFAHRDHLILAVACILQIWTVGLGSVGPIIKELAKAKSDKEALLKGSKGAGGEKGKGKDKEVTKDKPKRKSPTDTLPSSTEEWSQYEVPDEVLEAFQQLDAIGTAGINQRTITKPGLTLHCLNELTSSLRAAGYNHLTLPVLALRDLLTRGLLPCRPANSHVHLLAMEVCIELNLTNGASFHEKLVGALKINEEEQAKSREEIIQWNEKKCQARRQECSNKQHTEPTNAPEVHFSGNHFGRSVTELHLYEVWMDTARILVDLAQFQPAREFLDEAELAASAFSDNDLLARIHLTRGRLALGEANYGEAVRLAKLALCGSNPDEQFWFDCTCLLTDSLASDPDLEHGSATAHLELVQAINILRQYCERQPNRDPLVLSMTADIQLRMIRLEKVEAIAKFTAKTLSVSALDKLLLTLCSRLESISSQLIQQAGHSLKAVPVYMELADCNRLLAHHLPDTGTEEQRRRRHLGEAFVAARRAVRVAETMMFDVQRSVPLIDLRNCNLTLHREESHAKLLLADICLEIFELYVDHEREIQQQDLRKNSLLKAVEDYIKPTLDQTDSELAWINVVEAVFDFSMATLNDAYSLVLPIPDLKAKCLYRIGRCLRLKGLLVNPDAPMQWDLRELDLESGQKPQSLTTSPSFLGPPSLTTVTSPIREEVNDHIAVDDRVYSQERGLLDTSLVAIEQQEKVGKYEREIAKLQMEWTTSQDYFTQAGEVLMQTLGLSLHNDLLETGGQAAEDLINMSGQLDLTTSIQLLALFQSCRAGQELRRLLATALRHAQVSRPAAILRQLAWLNARAVTTNMRESHFYRSASQTLKSTSLAWRLTEVSPRHFDLLKDLPPFYTLCILQHSHNGCYLYAGFSDRPKPSGGGGMGASKLSKLQATQMSTRQTLLRLSSSPAELSNMLSQWHEHKSEVSAHLLRAEYKRSRLDQRLAMIREIESASVTAGWERTLQDSQLAQEEQDKVAEHPQKTALLTELTASADYLESTFTCLLGDLESYLAPFIRRLQLISGSCLGGGGYRPSTAVSGASAAAVTKPSAVQGGPTASSGTPGSDAVDYLVFLVDPTLAEFPLEALPQFRLLESVVAMSRDFSLQLLYNRLQGPSSLLLASEGDPVSSQQFQLQQSADAGSSGVPGAGPSVAGDKRKSDKGKLPSRIPGLRDASKKQNKIIPLNRQLPPGCQPLDTSQIRYIVDSHLDCSKTETDLPINHWATLVNQPADRAQQFTPRWLGVLGSDHVPSPGEYETYLKEGTALVYYGMERFLAELAPDKAVNLNLTDCQFLGLYDLVQTRSSVSRQSKSDVLRNHFDLDLEKPVSTAMLMSLAGVRAISTNQWHTSLKDNAAKLSTFMADILEGGKTLGQAVFYQLSPQRRPKPPSEGQAQTAATTTDTTLLRVQQLQHAADEPGKENTADEVFDSDHEPREQFNMVLYGLPSLMVTQLS